MDSAIEPLPAPPGKRWVSHGMDGNVGGNPAVFTGRCFLEKGRKIFSDILRNIFVNFNHIFHQKFPVFTAELPILWQKHLWILNSHTKAGSFIFKDMAQPFCSHGTGDRMTYSLYFS